MYNNANVYYITAKKDTKVSDLLRLNLPDKFKDRSETILQAGVFGINVNVTLTIQLSLQKKQ